MDMVDDLFVGRIKWYWESGRVLWQGARDGLQDPKLYDNAEYLYKEVKKREAQITANA